MGQEEKTLIIPDETTSDKKTDVVSPSSVLKDNTKVIVKSLVPSVYYTCLKTMDSFMWEEVGDEQEMTYMQIKTMKVKYPRYFTEKWLLICNDEILKKLNLISIFATKVTNEDMKKFYGSDVKAVENLLVSLNDNAKIELSKKIINDVKKGKIVNIKIIRLLEKYLDIQLMELV